MSNFDEALDRWLTADTLRLLIALVRRHYELWGDWPTEMQLRAALKKPSS